ncbi:MAG TPA: fructosamine kinase, partial [Actinopolymorphaceae bacterium]
MARHANIAAHIATLLGTAVVATNPVAGGETCVATRARLSDGRSVFVKARPGAPTGFFGTEAYGLTWLAAGARGEPAEASLTPAVLGYNRECLV